MILSLTDQKGKKIIVILSCVTYIVDHEISGTVINFGPNQTVRVQESVQDIEKKIKANGG